LAKYLFAIPDDALISVYCSWRDRNFILTNKNTNSLWRRLIKRNAFLLAAMIVVFICKPVKAQELIGSLATQSSLTDTKDGPKEQLRTFGVQPDVWITQICQGIMSGTPPKNTYCGGKIDAFLRVDAEKLGLWKGFHVFTQFEQYTGNTVNNITC
jgi:porin